MVQECQHCGKKGSEFDMAWEGKQCRRPIIADPAVGGWWCEYKPLPVVDGVTQDVATSVVQLKCPSCEQLHDPGSFVGGEKYCTGCGNTIRSE
ncbi:hypothetical protein BHR43_17600 [Aeromonas salmonicida subsp. salmonicida]|nr:hypothetical protein NX85_17530 [Aeromonas salmonicida subsp. salmonicida]KHE98642.1 hypothetical protein NV17_08125 [Aeromonas salmonicida subsp. salmonicida]OKA85905.1 hypothetical protein BHR43_17600 [Aeromonas salmonicida subsp. salmonicida]OKA88482.1 hypothetical protein BHR44_05880 [Aeromonas salmonicida subsp. salmonicida]OKA91193.1 hypothetical protein BHR45_06135 [Aeromonas salmonicida subsp. salmonicida]